MQAAVYEAVVAKLKEYASRKALKGDETRGIKEAYDVIKETWQDLSHQYKKKQEVQVDQNQGM